MTRLTTLAGAEAVSERAAAEIVRRLQSARRERGVAHLALSGGTTPSRTYELLARDRTSEIGRSSWDGVEVWFADERCVAAQDEQSNYRLAHETLLEPAGIPPERVHRMEGELGPEQGAERYARALDEHVRARDRDLPVLDAIVLGIGPDGHVASLFPGAATLDAGERALCLPVHDSPKPPPERITLSLQVLRAARCCLLLATSAAKADAIAAMLAAPSRHVPASLLRRGRLSVFVDDAAAPSPPRG
jgi:6-phosphogluconolactonase